MCNWSFYKTGVCLIKAHPAECNVNRHAEMSREEDKFAGYLDYTLTCDPVETLGT